MRRKKSAINVIFIFINIVLVAALICSLVIIKSKDDALKENSTYISTIKAQIAENETKLSDEQKKISEYEAQIAEKDKKNSEISSQLAEAQKNKKKLEDENAALKKKIETLSAAKRAAQSSAVTLTSPQAVSPDGRKVCYLTFDDGPSNNTLKILDILKKYDAKATFFVINNSNINYIKRIHGEGHTVGLHSASHDYAKIYRNTDAYFSDLKTISDKVESIIGVKSTVIRFPGGSSNAVSKKYSQGIMSKLVKLTAERGYSFFDWNVSSGDAEKSCVSKTKIINNVLSYSKNKNSICVLMHDSAVKTTTAEALPEIIENLKRMGFTFEAIKPETFGYHHGRLNN